MQRTSDFDHNSNECVSGRCYYIPTQTPRCACPHKRTVHMNTIVCVVSMVVLTATLRQEPLGYGAHLLTNRDEDTSSELDRLPCRPQPGTRGGQCGMHPRTKCVEGLFTIQRGSQLEPYLSTVREGSPVGGPLGFWNARSRMHLGLRVRVPPFFRHPLSLAICWQHLDGCQRCRTARYRRCRRPVGRQPGYGHNITPLLAHLRALSTADRRQHTTYWFTALWT